MINNNEFLTVEEAADLIRIHPETLRQWLREDKFPGAKIGDNWRIRRADIDAFFEKTKRG